MEKKKSKNAIQALKFSMIGILNTLIDYVVFYLLVAFTPVDKSVAVVIATGIAMTNSYLMNRFFTFSQKGTIKFDEIFKFIVVNLLSMGTSILFIYIFYDLLHVEVWVNQILSAMSVGFLLGEAQAALLAKILATPFVLTVNFIGNKLWVFRDKK